MTQDQFKKAQELQEQLAKVTKEIEGSYLPDGFMYRSAEISYNIRNCGSGDLIRCSLSIPTEIIEAVIHEVRDFHIEKQCELTKQFEEL
jgi:hypothetical protein